ncbi:hypothetical protein K4K57_011455 [Colletotrichum sp. SAR 10_99]|nr:hypothetical protein K4K55_004764 [Colletotrichum sp. SAR 10_96]KAJ5006047.1 hypothetical protein K4K57_011455 [Colletotrichum sp. SAR 10_99]
MHSTKFLAAILAVAGTGLAMPLEAPTATPASPSAAVEGLKESWAGCDKGHCPDNLEERWAAKKAKMPKKTSKPKDLSPEEFEKKVDEFWAEKIKKFKERLAAKKANKPESPPKPADPPCNKDKRDAAVDAACATNDDGFRKLSPEALSAILNAAPGPVVAKSMPAADKILPNDAIEKIRGLRGPGVVAPTAAVSGPLKLTKRPARTSSATGKSTASSATGTPTASSATGTSTASSAAGIPTTPSATGSSTAATATSTTTPKVTSVGVTGTPARPSATGTATGTTTPTKAHLAARDYPSNFADLVRVGPQIEKKTALSKRGRITRIPVLDDATRERLIAEDEIIVLTGKRKPGSKPQHS